MGLFYSKRLLFNTAININSTFCLRLILNINVSTKTCNHVFSTFDTKEHTRPISYTRSTPFGSNHWFSSVFLRLNPEKYEKGVNMNNSTAHETHSRVIPIRTAPKK